MNSVHYLPLIPLKKALSLFEKAAKQPKNEFIRDATNHRFKYTFELCWKTLKRYLELHTGFVEYNTKKIICEGAKQGLLSSIDT